MVTFNLELCEDNRCKISANGNKQQWTKDTSLPFSGKFNSKANLKDRHDMVLCLYQSLTSPNSIQKANLSIRLDALSAMNTMPQADKHLNEDIDDLKVQRAQMKVHDHWCVLQHFIQYNRKTSNFPTAAQKICSMTRVK